MIVRSYTADLFWREERWYMVGTSCMGTYNRKTSGLWIPSPTHVVSCFGTEHFISSVSFLTQVYQGVSANVIIEAGEEANLAME